MVGRFFSFSTLNISYHFLLAYKISVEKSTDSLMKVPLYVKFVFLLSLFKFLSWSLIFDNLIRNCIGVSLFQFILFETLSASWSWISVSFPSLGKFSAIISLNNFLAPFLLVSFSEPYNANICPLEVVPYVP